MSTLIGFLVILLAFAAFPLIGRERKNRKCLMCPIKRALGGCGGCHAGEEAESVRTRAR